MLEIIFFHRLSKSNDILIKIINYFFFVEKSDFYIA